MTRLKKGLRVAEIANPPYPAKRSKEVVRDSLGTNHDEKEITALFVTDDER